MSEKIGYEISLDALIDGCKQLKNLAEGDPGTRAKADQWLKTLQALNLPGSMKVKVFPRGVDLDKLDEAKVIKVD